MHPVIIVGGGVSGLAAGVGLSSLGVPVTLLEQRRVPGGRAFSFIDRHTGETIDNGQHALIAGYEQTFRFLEQIGTRHLVSVQKHPAFQFHHPERGYREFRLPPLAPPLNLVAGLLASDLLAPLDRLRMLRAGFALQRFSSDPTTVAEQLTVDAWLDAVGQSEECKRSLWEPLAVSIMNEHIGRASASVLLRSLQTAFLGRAGNSSLALPSVGLSALYVDPAFRFISGHGGMLRCDADVAGLSMSNGLVSHALLRDGTAIPCSAAILAVPHTKIRPLLPAELSRSGFLSTLGQMQSSPIISVHLWFKEDFMSQQVLGLIGRSVQWVFNRRKISRDRGGPEGHLSATISAAHALIGQSNDAIIRLAVEDLAGVFGAAAEKTLHAIVIRERSATFSPTPAAERLRPGPRSPVPNLFLAGDWTSTGYPGTIEGAVMSANRCVALAVAIVA